MSCETLKCLCFSAFVSVDDLTASLLSFSFLALTFSGNSAIYGSTPSVYDYIVDDVNIIIP